jgi:hypothetical protein
MKTIYLFTILLFVLPIFGMAQSPEAFNYQAVVRDNSGNIMASQNVSFQVSILETTSAGNSVYTETHAVATNGFGLATLSIGSGALVSGNFNNIAWGSDAHFIQIELDENGGSNYQLMGVSQLMTVPYAMHATTVENDMVDDADADPTNEVQDISLSGTDLSITAGSTIDLSVLQDGVNDADADPVNEIQDISLSGTDLSITSGSTVDLSGLQDGVNDADADPANEIQDISLNGTDLTITSGSTVDLSGLGSTSPWTDISNNVSLDDHFVSITQNTPGTALYIEGGLQPLRVRDVRGAGSEFSFNEYGETIWKYGLNEYARIDINGGPAGYLELMDVGTTRIYLNSGGNSYINGGNVGIGTATPTSKLEVDNGDVEVVDSANGVILRSPNGTRYRITIDNAGNLTTTPL